MRYYIWSKRIKNHPTAKIPLKMEIDDLGQLKVSTCDFGGKTVEHLFTLKIEGYISLNTKIENIQFITNKLNGHIIAMPEKSIVKAAK